MPPSWRKEADLEDSLPQSFIEILGESITGIDMAQTLIAASRIDVNQPMLDDREAAM